MFKHIYVPVDNSEHSNRAIDVAVELARAFGSKLTGCHVYAARLHDYRFKQMEYTLPDEYKDETELERQRKIHDSLIAMGLQLISDSYLDVMGKKAEEAGLAFERTQLVHICHGPDAWLHEANLQVGTDVQDKALAHAGLDPSRVLAIGDGMNDLELLQGAAIAVVAACRPPSEPPGPVSPPEEARALWVSRFEYGSPSDIDSIVARAARTNFNVIFFQVRGAGGLDEEIVRDGPWGIFRKTVTTLHGPTAVRYETSFAGDLPTLKAGDIMECTTQFIRNPVTNATSGGLVRMDPANGSIASSKARFAPLGGDVAAARTGCPIVQPSSFAAEYVSNFLHGGVPLTVETQYALYQELLPIYETPLSSTRLHSDLWHLFE